MDFISMLWRLFEITGSISVYLLYRELVSAVAQAESSSDRSTK